MYMKYILITISFASIFVLSGCFESNSGNSVGGVFKSDDSGRTFVSKNIINEKQSLSNSNVTAMAVDLSNNDIVYAGTQNNDMYVSVDGAETWTQMYTALTGIENVIVNPFNTQILYVSGLNNGRGSVVKSVDKGDTWERIYVEPADTTNITSMVMSPLDGDIVYIGTSGGTIAKTTNAGKTWENLYKSDYSVNKLLIDAGDVNTLYALVSTSDILKSRDNGITFESIKELDGELESEQKFDGLIYSMTVSPQESGTIVIGTDKGVFRSNDYGYVWSPVDIIASTIGIPIHAIEINPHNSTQLVYAAAKAVYTSVGDGWAITDTTSNRIVDVILHDPIDNAIVYLGLKKVK